MAGKVGSASFAVLLVDGYNLLAAKVQGVTHKIEAVLQPSHGLGDATEAATPTGTTRATLTQGNAFFDDSTNGIHTMLSAIANLAISRIVAYAFAGNVIGKPFVGAQGLYAMGYEVLGASGKLTNANVSYSASGQVDRGVVLQNWTARTATFSTKTDGASVDYTLDSSQRSIPIASISTANPGVVSTSVPHGLTTGQKVLIAGTTTTPSVTGQQTVTVITPTTFSVPVNVTSGQAGAGGSFVLASTVNGGAGYLEVSDYSGFTQVVVKVRSSADDTTYADLITFTTVTAAPFAERQTVAGTVDRYLCVTGTVTGSGSITPFVGFARF
jgi:hypothetical protein